MVLLVTLFQASTGNFFQIYIPQASVIDFYVIGKVYETCWWAVGVEEAVIFSGPLLYEP